VQPGSPSCRPRDAGEEACSHRSCLCRTPRLRFAGSSPAGGARESTSLAKGTRNRSAFVLFGVGESSREPKDLGFLAFGLRSFKPPVVRVHCDARIEGPRERGPILGRNFREPAYFAPCDAAGGHGSLRKAPGHDSARNPGDSNLSRYPSGELQTPDSFALGKREDEIPLTDVMLLANS
jgi:hypothetical protein